jgi:prolyl-tRNA editing enzyme YbaK/EbsC (Cys-tRNA(Pro) deacylase)
MHPSTEAFVEEARDRYDFDVDVHEFEAGTKTAEDAADQIGCDVAQIASSIVVDADGDLVVVVTSGANRVDFDRVAALRDVPADAVGMADAGDIKDVVGWSIGGVPPFCHDTSVPVYVDETLLGFDEVWAAGGTPQAVFPIDPETLVELSDGTVESVAS